MVTVELNTIYFLCIAETNQTTMLMETRVTIKFLQINQKSFTIKLKVLWVGYQQNCLNKFLTKIQKIIMIDEEVRVKHFKFRNSVSKL